jgi:hypothetical protein
LTGIADIIDCAFQVPNVLNRKPVVFVELELQMGIVGWGKEENRTLLV